MEKNMDTNFDFTKTGKFNFDQVGKRMPYSTPPHSAADSAGL